MERSGSDGMSVAMPKRKHGWTWTLGAQPATCFVNMKLFRYAGCLSKDTFKIVISVGLGVVYPPT